VSVNQDTLVTTAGCSTKTAILSVAMAATAPALKIVNPVCKMHIWSQQNEYVMPIMLGMTAQYFLASVEINVRSVLGQGLASA
jgi:uncharacterized protein (UPF0333 family)